MIKKLLFAACLMTGMSTVALAQIDNTFVFQKSENGEVLENGAVINVSEEGVSQMGEKYIASHLFVKNNTDDYQGVAVEVDITQISNGGFQICYPAQCTARKSAVEKFETEPGEQEPQSSVSLQDEWFYAGEGTMTATLTLKLYDVDIPNPSKPWMVEYIYRCDGPKVTVNYIKSSGTGIDSNIVEKEISSIKYYDMAGRMVETPSNGVYVKKTTFADGKEEIKKTFVK